MLPSAHTIGRPSRHDGPGRFSPRAPAQRARCYAAVALLAAGLCLVLLAWAVPPVLAQQALPTAELRTVFPAGAQAGSSVEVQIVSGSQLEETEELVFSHPDITGKPKLREPDRFYPEPRPVENTFVVAVAANVPPGIYELRARGKFGLSNARLFAVGALPEIREEEDNNSLEKANPIELGTVVNGLAEAAGYDYFRFTAKRGDPLLVECQARRVDSAATPVLTLYDAEGQELARACGTRSDDPAIALPAPADGEYVMRVHELTFGGNQVANNQTSGNAPYRLTMRTGAWIDFVDPPLVPRGGSAQVTLFGRNLGGEPAGIAGDDGRPLEKLTVTIEAPKPPAAQAPGVASRLLPECPLIEPLAGSLDLFAYRYAAPAGASNAVVLALADGPIVAERDGENDAPVKAQPLEVPCEVAGRFDRAGDHDWYRFNATKGQRLWIEVASQRLGVPSDPLLVVQQVVTRPSGESEIKELTVQDDREAPIGGVPLRLESADPAWLLEAPDDGEYRLLVRDQFGSSQGGPRYAYRLRIAPPRPDFRLLAIPGALLPGGNNRNTTSPTPCLVPLGGTDEVLVVALRSGGFDGPIELKLDQPPPGVEAPTVVMPEGVSAVSLVLRVAPDAKPLAGALRIVGTGQVEGQPLVHPAAGLERVWVMNNQTVAARLSDRVAMAIDQTASVPCRAEPMEEKTWRMARGGKLEIPLQLVKQQDDFKGKVSFAPIGLPQTVRAGNVELEPGKPGKLTLDLDPRAPVGALSVLLRGQMEIDYRQHPDLAERTQKDAERIDGIAKELAAAQDKASAERQKADQLAQQTTDARNRAENEARQAKEKSAQVDATAKSAVDKQSQAKQRADEAAKRAAEAKAAVASASDDEAKKAAQAKADQAQREAAEAKAAFDEASRQAEKLSTEAKTQQEAAAKAQAALEKGDKEAKAAAEAKTKAAEAEQQAKQQADEAKKLAQQVAEQARRAADAAKPKKVLVGLYARPVSIEVVAYPAEIAWEKTDLAVAAGEQVALGVRAKRDFGFEEEITFQLQAPSGLQGLRLAEATKIEKGKNEARLTIATDAKSKPGTYAIELVTRMNFNGRPLERRDTLQLTVSAAPEAPAK